MEHLSADSISTWNPGDLKNAADFAKPMLTSRVSIFNFTDRHISASDIRGFKIVHPPVSSSHMGFKGQGGIPAKRGIVIVLNDQFSLDARQNILDLDDFEHLEYNPVLAATIKGFGNQSRYGSETNVTIFISEHDLRIKGEVRIDAAGVLIKRLPHAYERGQFRKIPDHPLSIRGLMKAEADKLKELEDWLPTGDGPAFRREVGKRESIFTQSMTVIENDGTTYGTLYVRKRAPLVDDKFQVATMVATRSFIAPPGLYVRTNVSSTVALTEDKIHLEHVSDPAKFALYGVYRTAVDAETPDAVTLAQLAVSNQATQLSTAKQRLELEIEKTDQIRLELDRTKNEYANAVETAKTKHEQLKREAELKQEAVERQAERANEEHKQAMEALRAKAVAAEAEAKALREKLEFERLKEVNERNAHRRKNVQEIIKSIVPFVTGVVVLFKFLKDLLTKVPVKVL